MEWLVKGLTHYAIMFGKASGKPYEAQHNGQGEAIP
jgi:hypothetical protein